MKKFGLSLLVFGLVLVGGFSSSVQKAHAGAETIALSSVEITGPNQITIVFAPAGGATMVAAPKTAFAVGALVLVAGGARNIDTLNSLTVNTAVYTFSGAAVAADETGTLTFTTPTSFTDTGGNTLNGAGYPSAPASDGQVPTVASAVLNNTDGVAQTVDLVVTGTNFDHFASSGTADAAGGVGGDLEKLSLNAWTASSAHIDDATTMTIKFNYTTAGTGKVGATPFLFHAGAVHDVGSDGNIESSLATGVITDNAKPVLISAVLSKTATRNRITFTYSEIMTVTSGASTGTKGDTTTAGTVAGFGVFATGGAGAGVVVPTLFNTVAGSTNVITVDIADQAGGYMTAASTTAPSGDFTPADSAEVKDANNNQVLTTVTPTSSGGGTWDLVKPTLTSITVSDAAGNNGMIDQAALLFNEAVRANSFTNADGTLGSTGTLTGIFTVGTTTATFNRGVDNNALDTTAAAGDFTYSAATTKITDVFGNLLGTLGSVLTGIAEVDGAKPIVVSVSPANASVNQSNTADIVVVFSEAMKLSTFDATTFTTKDAGVATGDTYTASLSGDLKTLNLAHTIYRQKGHVYTAAFTAGVTDNSSPANALSLTGLYTWTFTPITTRTSSSSYATDITAPTNTSVAINGGAALVNTSNVTLTLAATGATSMMIGNNPDFYGMAWETYATSKAWTLTSGNGSRTVYAKFKDLTGNVSNSVSATTNVDSSATVTTTTTTTTTDGSGLTVVAIPITITSTVAGCGTRTSGFSTVNGTTCVGNVSTVTIGVTSGGIIAGCNNGTTGFSISSGTSCAGNTGTITTTTTYNFGTTTLKNGSKGDGVKELQKFLNKFLKMNLKEDGMLGPKTIAVIKKWQKDHGLVQDGLVGKLTKAAMNQEAEDHGND